MPRSSGELDVKWCGLRGLLGRAHNEGFCLFYLPVFPLDLPAFFNPPNPPKEIAT